MKRMSQKKFEEIVDEGISSVPEKFLAKLNNVGIVIENEPKPEQLRKLKIRKGWTLFGLYEGVPQVARNAYYGAVLPDKITIFRKPIIEAAEDEENMKKIVRDTVWHEIAHHFGMDEARVRRAETNRKKFKHSYEK
jgi:predicted Zn-dependent protease with MMP-like domain